MAPPTSLSVVITCRDDPRLLRTVASIDAPVEIVVVLNGSPADFVRRMHAELPPETRIEVLPEPNRARSVDHGIRSATHDGVLLMDADCVFEPGSVGAVQRAFDEGSPDEEVYKGRIVYDGGPTLWGRVIARSRTQRNRRLSAYKPALAFSRRLRERLGGYFFDPRLVWRSDAELDQRVRRSGLRLVPVEGCRVHHAPLSLLSDLRSSFGYGVGTTLASQLGLPLIKPERSVWVALRDHGLAAGCYMLMSNSLHIVGETYARVRPRHASHTQASPRSSASSKAGDS